MRKQILFVILGLMPIVGLSKVVTEREAAVVAERFFSKINTVGLRSSIPHLPLTLEWKGCTAAHEMAAEPVKLNEAYPSAEAPEFYVFNRGTNDGFIIVSGEDAARPILAYAFEGSFGTDHLPENLKGWMNGMAKEISTARKFEIKPTREVAEAWSSLTIGVPVIKLETPLWNQDKPYNSKCPSYSGGIDWHAYTGCTITAASIVMGYHQWPDGGVGELKGYQSGGLGVWVDGVNLSDHIYRWDKMPEINGNILPADETSAEYKEQEDAISTLMRDVGVMLKAKYDYDATSAMPDMIAFRLPRYMKYDEGIVYAERKYFSDELWVELLKEELNQRRPIAFAGYDIHTGHSFVLDGYDNQDRFSVNWGWGGISNGYFYIDALNPSEQGAGGGASGYNADQEAVMRILPKKPEMAKPHFEEMLFAKSSVGGSNATPGLKIVGEHGDFTQGSSFTISAGIIMNWGSDYFEGQIKLAVTDDKGNIKSELYTTPGVRCLHSGNVVMPLDEARDLVEVTLVDPVLVGDRIRLLYLSTDGNWKSVTTRETDVPWEIVLKEGESTPLQFEVETQQGINLGKYALAAYSSPVSTIPSDNTVEAFYAETKDNHTIILKKIEPVNGKLVIPANTGVLLATDDAKSFTMDETLEPANEVPSSNLLKSSGPQGVEISRDINAYVLSKHENQVLFHTLEGTDRKVKSNCSYLVMPSESKAEFVDILFEGISTGIETFHIEGTMNSAIYDLSGRKVDEPSKGSLYIRNGKKFFAR